MKKHLVLLWLLLPLPLVVLHFGRGQQWLALDKAHALVKNAAAAEKLENWQQATHFYQEAAKHVGTGNTAMKLRLDLAQVRTRYHAGEAVAAIDLADKLLADRDMASMPGDFQRESRELAGRIHYYAAWVLRLEGAKRDLWLEEAELARQNFRLLTEESATQGEKGYSTKQQENLESAVKLQQLSLIELMARPLPKEGKRMSGQGLSEQMNERREQRGKKSGPGKSPGKDGDGPPDKGAGKQRFQPGSGS